MFSSFFNNDKKSIQRKRIALQRQMQELDELEKQLDDSKYLFKDSQQISYSYQSFYNGKEKKSITRFNNNGKQVEVIDNQVNGKTVKHEETNNFNGNEEQVKEFINNFKHPTCYSLSGKPLLGPNF